MGLFKRLRADPGLCESGPIRSSAAIIVDNWRRNRCEKRRTQAVCRSSSNRTDEANLNFSPELYRLIFFSPKLNFSPSTKKTTEYSFGHFFPLTMSLLQFCYNAGHHAISRQKHTGFSTGFYPVYEVYWYSCGGYGRTDGRSRDYYVTTKISWLDRLPNFLSNGAALTRQRAGSAIISLHTFHSLHTGKANCS